MFKYFSNLVTFKAALLTTNVMLAHGLPPEPLEPERSSTSESQAPMEAGAEMTTLRSMGLAGAETRTEDLGITFQLEQSVLALQAALTSPDSRLIGLPIFRVDEDPAMTVTVVASCDHWHEEAALP